MNIYVYVQYMQRMIVPEDKIEKKGEGGNKGEYYWIGARSDEHGRGEGGEAC